MWVRLPPLLLIWTTSPTAEARVLKALQSGFESLVVYFMFAYYDNTDDIIWHVRETLLPSSMVNRIVIMRLPDGRYRVQNALVVLDQEPPPEPRIRFGVDNVERETDQG